MKIIHVGPTKLIQGKFDTVFVQTRSVLSGKLHSLPIHGTTIEALEIWFKGEDRRLVQDAFPLLSADEREFLLSGISNEEWNAAFPPEKETE
jgi:hypothetical protein